MASLGTRLGEVSVKMELVTMIPDRPEVTKTVVEELQGKIFEVLSVAKNLKENEREEMKTAIEKVFKERLPSTKLESIKDGATVHAEAALMGVAYAIANNELKDSQGKNWYIEAVSVCKQSCMTRAISEPPCFIPTSPPLRQFQLGSARNVVTAATCCLHSSRSGEGHRRTRISSPSLSSPGLMPESSLGCLRRVFPQRYYRT